MANIKTENYAYVKIGRYIPEQKLWLAISMEFV